MHSLLAGYCILHGPFFFFYSKTIKEINNPSEDPEKVIDPSALLGHCVYKEPAKREKKISATMDKFFMFCHFVFIVGLFVVLLRQMELNEQTHQKLRESDKYLQQCRYDKQGFEQDMSDCQDSKRKCKAGLATCELQKADQKREHDANVTAYESKLTEATVVINQLNATVIHCSKQNENLTELYQALIANTHEMVNLSELNCANRLFTKGKKYKRKINELNTKVDKFWQELSECKDARETSWFKSVAEFLFYAGFTHKANQKA